MRVDVKDNNVEQALRVLKRKMQREGLFRAMRSGQFYEKPSVRRARVKNQNIRRLRKALAKRMEREGY